MKKIVFILFFISVNLYPQDNSKIKFDLKSTDWFKDDFKKSLLTFSVADENKGVISARNFSGGCMVEHFDKDMNLINKLEIEHDDKDRTILDGYINGGNLFLIEYFLNEKEDRSEYAIIKLSNDLKILERKHLFNIPIEEMHFSHYSRGLINDIDNILKGYWTLSKDHFVFSFNTSTDGNERHKIKLFDKTTLNEKFEYVLDLDFKNSKTNFENLVIDDESESIFAAFSHFPDDKWMDIGYIDIRAGETYIFNFNKELKNSQKVDSEFLLATPRLKIEDDKIYLFDFYANENVRDYGYKGLSFHKFDKSSLKLETEAYNEFTDEFILQKYGKDKKRPFIQAVLTSIYSTDNGFIIDAEDNHISISGQKVGGINSFNDLMISSVDKSGNLNWFKNINKSQSEGILYSGYKSYFKDNSLFIVINADDDVKKYDDERRLNFKVRNSKKLKPYLIQIDSEGNWVYKHINNLNLDKKPIPIRNGQTSDAGLLFTTTWDKEKKMIKFSF